MFKRTIPLLTFLLFTLAAFSQDDLPDSIRLSLSNPLGTVHSHLYYLQQETFDAAKAGTTLNEENPEKAKDLAAKLKQILDGRGLYVDVGIIPQNPNYTDTATNKHRYVLFEAYPQIYVEKVGEKWLYSKRTVEAIPKLHKEVYPFGSNVLVDMFPKIGQELFLGLYVWQWLGMLIIAGLTVLVHFLLKWLAGFIIKQLIHSPYIPKEQRMVIQKAAGPISLMALTMLLELVVPVLQLPITTAKYVIMILDILTPVYATLAVYRLVDLVKIYMWKRAEASSTTLDDQLVPLLSKILRVVVVIFGFIYILSVLGVNVTALLAGLSIGGIALALAAQDTIKNLFGSLMIFLDRPFQIGEMIEWNGMTGTIEEVGFRSTRMRTPTNSLITVPNGELANTPIDNLGLRRYRRYRTAVGVTYDTPPDLIEKFVEGLRQLIENHPHTKKDDYEVHMNEMGPSSLNIIFHVFFEVDGWGGELKARHDLIMGTIRLAESLGVRFAFPSQTLYVEELPGQESLAPKYNTNKADIDKKIAAFMEEYKSKYEEK